MKDKQDKDQRVLLHHGSGGILMHELIEGMFVRAFHNPVLSGMTDSAIVPSAEKNLAFTTDSYVVDPIFFPGGDIGKLAVCGTVNDLSVTGATPVFISAAFIIEEGFLMKDLERIVHSMAKEAAKAGVKIVTGDTKVVNRGKCDKIFINTAGIGSIGKSRISISKARNIRPGDRVLINGSIGDHGMAILNARENLPFEANLKSDCCSLNHFIGTLLKISGNIRFMRDPTRGGLATVLNELASKSGFGLELNESKIPVKKEVRGMCELLGFDPMYLANEGKVVIVVPEKDSDRVLDAMKKLPEGRNSAMIGKIVKDPKKKVVLNTLSGGRRYVEMMAGDQLPRIC